MGEPTGVLPFPEGAPEKTCTMCGQTKPLTEFYRSTRTPDGKRPECRDCTRPERRCTDCGRTFRGSNKRCISCQRTERRCEDCGRIFTGHTRRCGICSVRDRQCTACGREFRGNARRCDSCLAKNRNCVDCGKRFKGTKSRCGACQATDRVCVGCNLPFRGHQNYCIACQTKDRTCTDCGREFRGAARRCSPCRWAALTPAERLEQSVRLHERRRQLLAAAEVDGPVPHAVYMEVLRSGPCSYCGAEAKTVDHIRPLIRGGVEHESNLTPACKKCNFSKGRRLLTEWHQDRVAHAVAACPKVAAEYELQLIEQFEKAA